MLKYDRDCKIDMIVIGTSAGGLDALMRVLPGLKSPTLSVAVVIHLPAKSRNLIPSLLAPDCSYEIKEAVSGENIEPQTIYVAPPDYHLCIEPNHTISLSSESPVNFSRPSIDVLFDSAAYTFQKRVMGILLTGANNDGALGLKSIKEQGGLTIVQDPKETEYPMMPQSALDLMRPDYIFSLDEISDFVAKMCLEGHA